MVLSKLLGKPGRESILSTLARRTFTNRPYKLYGPEIFPGIGTPFSRTTRYGATFAGRERGRTSLTLVGWVNYTPIFFKPSTECTISGGHWLLVATERFRVKAVLYGSFTGGSVRWNKDAKLAEVSTRLRVSGGTEPPESFPDPGELVGVLNHLPFPPLPPKFGGTLRLQPLV